MKKIPKKYIGKLSGAFYQIKSNDIYSNGFYTFIAFPSEGFDIDEKIHENLEGYRLVKIFRNINEEFILKAKIFASSINPKKKITEKDIKLENILCV